MESGGPLVKRLKISDIEALYSLIAKDFRVFSPREKNGVLALVESADFHKDSLSKFQTVMPAKSVFLSDVYNIEENPDTEKLAIFGLHLCDVEAIQILDRLFKHDPFYTAKRKESFLIATACQPTNNCFCDVFGANKHHGYDLYIEEELNGNYLVFAKSDRGAYYLDKISGKLVFNSQPQPISSGNAGDLNPEKLTRIIDDRAGFEKEWQMIANNCFGCGACTSVCPLCFCFDTVDRTNPKTGQCHRSRVPDSCFFNSFSKISNHDFRPTNSDRLYNWYHHKFVREPAHSKEYLCVGCGRCILACPASLNIKRILSTFNKMTERKQDEN
jgi:ferredoxin